MSLDPSEIQVLVPDDTGGLSVCGLADLYDRCGEFETIDELTLQTGIDTIDVDAAKIAAVRQLNETGDAAAYWGL